MAKMSIGNAHGVYYNTIVRYFLSCEGRRLDVSVVVIGYLLQSTPYRKVNTCHLMHYREIPETSSNQTNHSASS